ncbi:MAG: CDP-diacylglycerol--glycerol-3-phosphate 3-phosphatidyltransferase [Alphaproteobacteria bacterium]|nr:MAG: CDP-diacylglycerol--glycerol-3-phosphate 3-phosphatidyltransferase [Alphaproteobacteria bacterium]
MTPDPFTLYSEVHMKNQKMTLANKLTLLRFGLTPVIVVLILTHLPFFNWVAFFLFVFTAALDYFDGYFARKRNEKSLFGRVLDPIADKFLVIFCYLSLLISGHVDSFVSALLIFVLVLREVFISGLREQLASLKIEVPVSQSGKFKTVLQFVSIALLIMPTGLDSFYVNGTLLAATAFSLASAYQYTRVFIKNIDRA